MTKASISINRKVKDSDEWEKDFSDFIAFIGTACAKKALSLKKGDRIKLGDVDVSATYNKEKGKMYYNFKVFGFEPVGSGNSSGSSTDAEKKQADVDDGEVDERLPF